MLTFKTETTGLEIRFNVGTKEKITSFIVGKKTKSVTVIIFKLSH